VIAVTVALVVLATVSGPSGGPTAAEESLIGQLLVATEDMPDPRFAHTVIYMIRHDASGAQGLVVNRPVAEVPLGALLEQMGMDPRGVSNSVRLYSGGPVEPRRLLLLHTGDYSSERTLAVKDGIAVTWDPEILVAIAHGKGPQRVLFAVGYAGWAPGQLEAEIKAGGWVRASADLSLLFDDDYAKKWERATSRRKIDL
jgi:putative transcriptional regulator